MFTTDFSNAFEIRIRLSSTKLPWEEIEPIQVNANSPAEAQVITYQAAWREANCIEARWNWKGSLQGHYVFPYAHRFLAQFRVSGEGYTSDSGWHRLEAAREYVQAIFDAGLTYEEARIYDQVLKTYPFYIAH